jgi:EAL domain-containing protein (putative c-di-GMP-specific phosphodiesterase class I)
VDTLKIDQSFVKDIESLGSSSQRSRSLMKAFVGLARSLGVKLLAEGVESSEQHRFLCEIGCELGQGFLLDVPMPAQEIELLYDKCPPAQCAAL